VKSAWYVNLIPGLQEYPYNTASLEVFNFIFFCLILLSVYILLRSVYKIRFSEAFNLHFVQLPYIFKVCKVCVILAVINTLSIYFLNLNLFGTPQRSVVDYVKGMDWHHVALFSVVSIVVAPVVEEIVFRGLLYVPLYRKVGRGLAIIMTSLIWTQIHFEDLPTSVGIFIMGLILGWLYDRTGSLLTTIVLHSFKNSWILFYLLK
jgi:membrane protease YdiL (CAAX protease family)